MSNNQRATIEINVTVGGVRVATHRLQIVSPDVVHIWFPDFPTPLQLTPGTAVSFDIPLTITGEP